MPEKLTEIPFTALGMDDKGRAVFLGRGDRLVRIAPLSIAKEKRHLLVIAPREYWLSQYGYNGKIAWDSAIDFVLAVSMNRDFDPNYAEKENAK